MTENTQTDVAAVERTPTGEILNSTSDAQANPPSESTTTTTSTSERPSLLNETKPAEPKPVEPAKGAPEKYEDYKVPEGFTLDPEIKTQADALFKGMGLSQEQAQSLVDFYTKTNSESAEAPYKAWDDMTSGWRNEAENHPALRGKLGAGQEINVRIGKFLDGMNDPQLASDFKALMDLTGAGNHPAFIRVIDYAASRLTEGTHVSGNGPTTASQAAPGSRPASAAAALWPNLPSARG